MPSEKRYDESGMRLTDCCGAHSTYHDDALCCKACWAEVDFGEGDGSEYAPEDARLEKADGGGHYVAVLA